MMRLGCIPTELLLERQSPALSHAERLRVEQHLAECDDCRREHSAMLSLQGSVEDKVQSSAKASVQDRAIARALLRAGNAEAAARAAVHAHAPAPARRFALAFAAAAALAVVALLGLGKLRNPAALPAIEVADAGRVTAGRVFAGTQALAPGQSLPVERELRPEGKVALTLGHAQVEVEGVEALSWSAKERAITLRGGVAEVDVDPSKRRSFRVVTPRFLVEVLGTHFRVAQDSVSVERGRVRVLSLARAPLAELGPGQRWSLEATPPATPVALQPAPAPAPAPAAAEPAPSSAAKPDASDAPRAAAASASELLASARHRLASRDTRGARSDLQAALAAGGSRAQMAEAHMLQGDCALVEGDAGGAVRAYLDVSRRFAGLRSAETALFAAARVESNRGNRSAARELLLSYRSRYPAGQFKSEVDARLKMLDQK
jgi:TolA-binding protein